MFRFAIINKLAKHRNTFYKKQDLYSYCSVDFVFYYYYKIYNIILYIIYNIIIIIVYNITGIVLLLFLQWTIIYYPILLYSIAFCFNFPLMLTCTSTYYYVREVKKIKKYYYAAARLEMRTCALSTIY